MSVQFGRWNFDGTPVDRDYLEKVKPLLAPYGPDAAGCYSKGSIHILFYAFQTTKESRRETQPHITASGVVIAWDGRLDNRAELIRQLRDVVTVDSTDVEIVAAAYEHWSESCLAMLIGDWALAIWNPHTRSLILAKDPIGTRHLYYSFDNEQVTWSSILDPLVLFAGRTFSLCEEYIAGWFSFFPAAHLTPYIGIDSVPPSSSVFIRAGKRTIKKYWDLDPDKQICYRADGEYEEHFRAVFARAVRRRLRSDSPILAELSGGMDSSSIVCMADAIIACGTAETPRLDTLSYYNDSEPNWNERPYFTKVEERRGRAGTHIDVSSVQQTWFNPDDSDSFAATPGARGGRASGGSRQFAACMSSHGNRVVLSGIGGDEVTGGVPTPMPELEDLLAGGQLKTLAHQLILWALMKRRPWFHLLFEAARRFLPPPCVDVPSNMRHPLWLNPKFVKQNAAALRGYVRTLNLFGPRPSFQDSLATVDALRRQLACTALSSKPPYEKSYPYLDRDLLEFIFAVPRAQLVRPGHRRSLMRRALVGTVPDELLNRKRKAYVFRAPAVMIATGWTSLFEMSQHMLASSLGIVNTKAFCKALEEVRNGQMVAIVPLMRTVAVEKWLTDVAHRKILRDFQNERQRADSRLLRGGVPLSFE